MPSAATRHRPTGSGLRHLRTADSTGHDHRRRHDDFHAGSTLTGSFASPRRRSSSPDTNEFAINSSNSRQWDGHIRAYVDDCLEGEDGPHGTNYNMRWIASLVAECHRILSRGGIFLYPADIRKGYAAGRLRLVYECNPIAFLIEQAGGAATTGDSAFSRFSQRTFMSGYR